MPDFRGFAAGDAIRAGEAFHGRVKENGDDDRKKRDRVEGSELRRRVELIDREGNIAVE